jgi:hypothetical protein
MSFVISSAYSMRRLMLLQHFICVVCLFSPARAYVEGVYMSGYDVVFNEFLCKINSTCTIRWTSTECNSANQVGCSVQLECFTL